MLLKIDDCQPLGLLRYLDRVDFGKVWRMNDVRDMERVLLQALADPVDLDVAYRDFQ